MNRTRPVYRPSEATKIRNAEMRAYRNAIRQKVRRAALKKMLSDATKTAKQEG